MNTPRELWNRGGFDRAWMSWAMSMGVMLGLWFLTGIPHELGHSVVCWYSGGEVYLPWVFTKFITLCDPFPEHIKEISWAMGGIFGVITSIVPLLIFKFLRKHNFILNGFLGCGFMQLGYTISESQMNAQYKVNDLEAILPIIILGTFSIIFFTAYIEKIRKFTNKASS